MRTYHKVLFFTKVPLRTKFVMIDIFQIYPLEVANMPTCIIQDHYPAIIEFWTDESENIVLEGDYGIEANQTATYSSKQKVFLTLLSSFSNNLFFTYTMEDSKWGVPISNSIPNNIQTSSWYSPLYICPEMSGIFRIEGFTEQSFRRTTFRPHIEYFTYDPNIDLNSSLEIEFTRFMNIILSSYFNLKTDVQKIVYTACTYTVNAMELQSTNKTLSLLAAFTSIETMVNLEYANYKAQKCKSCGQKKFSVAKKFRNFLLKYLGNSLENKRKFNKLYSLRSKIAHTGQRLKSDNLFANLPKDERHNELITRIEVLQFSKLAITNWLIRNSVEIGK